MIKSFASKQTENLYKGKRTKFDTRIIKRTLVKLDQIDSAENLDDLRIPPSNNLEALGGDRKGHHSIRINSQWRVCFIWNGGAEQVEVTDYH